MTSRIILSSGAVVKYVNGRRICIASLLLCFICVLPLLFLTHIHSFSTSIATVEDMFHKRGSTHGAAAAGEVVDDFTNSATKFAIGPRPARKLLQSSDEGGDGNGSNGDGSYEGGDGNRSNGDGSYEGGDGSSDGDGGDGSSDTGDMNGTGTQCSKNDITIYQGETTPLPSGIPAFSVEIVNMCASSSCSISDIHISCGWFSSARLVNPTVFRHMDYNDCLVNDGLPLGPGQSLSFQYANTFRYPLSVSSVALATQSLHV